ncbi:MAG: TatD family hydrolase [Coraliomargarita sp.]|nr:TatD family hydrolase [Coraliomargarita sp.]
MPASLYDAHIHLANSSLLEAFGEVDRLYAEIGVRKVVCNGTSPDDWDTVLNLASKDPRIIPAIGLHPWKVNDAPENWQKQFLSALDQGAQAIGEVGLDQWIDGHDIRAQQDAFRFQLQAATTDNLPISIHCLQAIGPLMDTLRSNPLPRRGLQIHAYNGPTELIPELVGLGTYFSFNSGQLRPDRPKVIERIRATPSDRILVETDAPDFLPSDSYREFYLDSPDLCHPANIRCGYKAIAEIRGVDLKEFALQVESNFHRYFE